MFKNLMILKSKYCNNEQFHLDSKIMNIIQIIHETFANINIKIVGLKLTI